MLSENFPDGIRHLEFSKAGFAVVIGWKCACLGGIRTYEVQYLPKCFSGALHDVVEQNHAELRIRIVPEPLANDLGREERPGVM